MKSSFSSSSSLGLLPGKEEFGSVGQGWGDAHLLCVLEKSVSWAVAGSIERDQQMAICSELAKGTGQATTLCSGGPAHRPDVGALALPGLPVGGWSSVI